VEVNVNIFKTGGTPHKLKVLKMYEGQHVPIPQASIILYTSVIDVDPPYLELWVAVPETSVIGEQKFFAPEQLGEDSGFKLPTGIAKRHKPEEPPVFKMPEGFPEEADENDFAFDEDVDIDADEGIDEEVIDDYDEAYE
jgi:hypothetical protein